MLRPLILFLLLNFGALAIGGLFTGQGVPSDWYAGLNKAPWTPPGWVFGAAWTTIMACLAVYMAQWWRVDPDKRRIMGQYALQWVLNVSWNPVFFYLHATLPALVIIMALSVLVGYWLFANRLPLKAWSVLVLPYFVWLLIATSLNAYVVFNN
jgi:tryptophan-rich sensory protein